MTSALGWNFVSSPICHTETKTVGRSCIVSLIRRLLANLELGETSEKRKERKETIDNTVYFILSISVNKITEVNCNLHLDLSPIHQETRQHLKSKCDWRMKVEVERRLKIKLPPYTEIKTKLWKRQTIAILPFIPILSGKLVENCRCCGSKATL